MAGGLDSLLCNVLGLGQFPSPLRCGRFPDMRGLGVQQRVVALKPGCLVARRRLPVVSRCKLAIGRGSALNWWDSIYVGYAVSTVGAFAFHVPCGWVAGTLLAASRLLGPSRNLNYAFADPVFHRAFGPAPIHLALIFAVLAGTIYWPTHRFLIWILPTNRRAS